MTELSTIITEPPALDASDNRFLADLTRLVKEYVQPHTDKLERAYAVEATASRLDALANKKRKDDGQAARCMPVLSENMYQIREAIGNMIKECHDPERKEAVQRMADLHLERTLSKISNGHGAEWVAMAAKGMAACMEEYENIQQQMVIAI